MKIIDWKSPPLELKKIELYNKDVHLWKANLDVSADEIKRLKSILSADEKDRAERFKFSEHQNRFIAARGFLRQILNYYLPISASDIVFKYSDRGKPILLCNSIQFNVSHSQNVALYGITKQKLIGVDIEYLRSNTDCLNIARRFFNDGEYQAIKELKTEKQAQFFFNLWTIKEAYLKATGDGLIGGLDTVQTNIENTNINIVAVKESIESVNNWFFDSFIPQTDFVASVAIKNEQQPLTITQFYLN